MSRFHNLLKSAYRELITEQEQPPVPPTDTTGIETPMGMTPPPQETSDAQVQDVQKEPMSPEGMVFLVRLIQKALMIEDLEPEEEKTIADLGNIEEVNAREAIEKLMPIIRKYAPSTEQLPEA
jgi:hypothetical protein